MCIGEKFLKLCNPSEDSRRTVTKESHMDTICNYIIQNQLSGNCILHRRGFEVNIHLFKKSFGYRHLILSTIDYMKEVIQKSFVDYNKIKGISGANIGIPLNIVGIGEKDTTFFMINPHIVSESRKTKIVKSNCGSIRLQEKIEVKRYEWIKVEYYDTDGGKRRDKFDGAFGFTLQHEIDHNLGILITDKTK